MLPHSLCICMCLRSAVPGRTVSLESPVTSGVYNHPCFFSTEIPEPEGRALMETSHLAWAVQSLLLSACSLCARSHLLQGRPSQVIISEVLIVCQMYDKLFLLLISQLYPVAISTNHIGFPASTSLRSAVAGSKLLYFPCLTDFPALALACLQSTGHRRARNIFCPSLL